MSAVLATSEWRPLEAAHHARVDAATAAHRRRRHAHPVEDFLFTYYNLRPAQLRRWHPGVDVALEGAAERAGWKYYAIEGTTARLDVAAFVAARGESIRFVHSLLAATAARPVHLGCFGLHEWAMVYRMTPEQVRHASWPLRLGADGTDEVVRAHPLRCSHFDAFRFFTPPARPLNAVALQRDTQVASEQPGCLHANMDLYKWAYKLCPAVPGELVADCFDLAREVRELDMRASPYDLRELGYEPVQVETAAGKAQYVAAQRAFAARAQLLRERLIAVCERLVAG